LIVYELFINGAPFKQFRSRQDALTRLLMEYLRSPLCAPERIVQDLVDFAFYGSIVDFGYIVATSVPGLRVDRV